MENRLRLTATVKSPSKSSSLRRAEGFSLKEIKEAGRSINQIKELKVKIDYFRNSVHPENVERLKALKLPEKEGKKRKPFVKKERKRTPFKPKEEKPKMKRVEPPKGPIVKKKVEVPKKEKVKRVKKEKVKVEKAGIALTDLSGLGAATAKKFVELGVETVEELIKENPEELSSLIKGVSSDRLTKWIEEGKELIKQ
ncbi:MAG: helix-hairpin-helix domain-containing protein [Candidatus Thorarchaeota archaeon]